MWRRRPDWAAGHDQSQNGGMGGEQGSHDNGITRLLTGHPLEFPYAAPKGGARKADDVKPGLICPHQEQNCHHLLGSLNTPGRHTLEGMQIHSFVLYMQLRWSGFNPRSEGLCMQIGQSTGSLLSDALTMQPSQCGALNIGAGRHSQGAGGRGQESAPGWIVPAGLYPRQGGERRPAVGDK